MARDLRPGTLSLTGVRVLQVPVFRVAAKQRVPYSASMRLLRVSTSEETDGDTPSEERFGAIATDVLERSTGERVEVLTRVGWPDARLPVAVDRWLNDFRPDLVYFKTMSFPVCVQTVATRLLGTHTRLGAIAGTAGRMPVVARAFPRIPGAGGVQRLVRRSVGVAALIEPEEMVRIVEACIRAVVRRENVGLAVRAPYRPVYVVAPGARIVADARWAAFHEPVAALCRSLSVEYVDEEVDWDDERTLRLRAPDGLHLNAAGHRAHGQADGDAPVRAWRRCAVLS